MVDIKRVVGQVLGVRHRCSGPLSVEVVRGLPIHVGAIHELPLPVVFRRRMADFLAALLAMTAHPRGSSRWTMADREAFRTFAHKQG